MLRKPKLNNLWFWNKKFNLIKFYKINFFRVYYIFILYFYKKDYIYIIKKKKKLLSFHKFDTFIYEYFNLIKYNKLYAFNNNNNNKSIKGRKVNYNRKSKSYKLLKIYSYSFNYMQLYNVISLHLNVYNYKIYILICNNFGNFYFIPYAHNINLFKFYAFYERREIIDLQLSYLFAHIYLLKLSTIIFNIQSFIKINNFIKFIYCRSVGSTAKINMHIKNKLLTYIILPSKKRIYISSLLICFIYYNQIFKVEEFRKIPKSSVNLKLGKKQKVRGVAKNAIDHPHGGNTKIIKIKKNPWGKVN